jgi:hypothetical protein
MNAPKPEGDTSAPALPAEMWALTFDRSREDWACSRGLVKERVPTPRLDDPSGADAENALIRVKFAELP